MTMEGQVVAGIVFEREQPTQVSAEALFDWVVWQYPKKLDKRLIGAVRPPIPGIGWFPALIDPAKQNLLVYGHVETPFESPEQAAAFFDKHG